MSKPSIEGLVPKAICNLLLVYSRVFLSNISVLKKLGWSFRRSKYGFRVGFLGFGRILEWTF
jgi:hypothetical protein